MEQHNIGIPEMKIANLFEDIDILKTVQSLAQSILTEDRKLEMEKNESLKKLISNKFTSRIEI